MGLKWAKRRCGRTQFPLIVLFAITVHKCQSLTKDRIITDLGARDCQAGISYVAISRVTSLQGLLLETPLGRLTLYDHTPTEDSCVCVFLRAGFRLTIRHE